MIRIGTGGLPSESSELVAIGCQYWRKSLPPAHSIAQFPETEMLRLLSFTVFLATWWGAALLAGGEKLPPPPAVLAAIVAEANSGVLFSRNVNDGVVRADRVEGRLGER